VRNAILAAGLAFALLGITDTPKDDGTAAPAGIAPTSVTLAAVIAAHRKAIGRLAPGALKTSVERWAIKTEGLEGTESYVERDRDSRVDRTLGPLHTAYGMLAGRDWHQNENGEVVVERGLHVIDDVSAHALATLSKDVTLLGTVAKPVSAYVVKVAPKGGRLEYLYYDRSTYMIVRTERARNGRRIVTALDDFRTTAGLTEAWHYTTSDGRPENDGDYRMTSLDIGKPVDAALVAMPAATSPVVFAKPRVSIPIRMAGDRIIVPTKIQGHTVDFQLDSGASGVVLDSAVVDALALKLYGSSLGDTAGTYRQGSTIVPLISIGDISLQNLEVQSAPFTEWVDEKTPVAGLMGFDFIDGAVLHIDYLDGTLEAIDPATFVPPAGARALPIALDDDVPLVDVGIAKALGHLFIVDTGADNSAIFSNFVAAHPNDVTDRGLGDRMLAQFPFVSDFAGVGGTVDYRPLQVGPLTFAGYTFPKWMFNGTHDAPSFEGDDFEGLIGQDMLRNFDVYLDYRHEKIWLVPNARYNARWG